MTGATAVSIRRRLARWSSKSGFIEICLKMMKAIPEIRADSRTIFLGMREVFKNEIRLKRMKIKKYGREKRIATKIAVPAADVQI
jgi:hypothetical protein